MCLVKSIIANICQIMIHFHALDFNVCRSEERSDKFLLMLSVDISADIRKCKVLYLYMLQGEGSLNEKMHCWKKWKFDRLEEELDSFNDSVAVARGHIWI